MQIWISEVIIEPLTDVIPGECRSDPNCILEYLNLHLKWTKSTDLISFQTEKFVYLNWTCFIISILWWFQNFCILNENKLNLYSCKLSLSDEQLNIKLGKVKAIKIY